MINNSSGLDLSKYFADDPPSFFDEILQGPTSGGNLNLGNMDMQFKAPSSIKNDEADDIFTNVPDEVRNFWEPVVVEPGIPPMLTMPGVQSSDELLVDPIREAVVSSLGEMDLNQRKILTVDDVTQDERGLRMLISAGCYRSATNLTGRLLTIYGQGTGRVGQPTKHSPHSLQLWFTRLALLAKLGQYDLLQSEAEPFGLLNRRDVYYDFYPDMYADKKGSMASFSFRLLLAEIPMYTGNPKESLDRLSELADICNEIKEHYKKENELHGEFWRQRELRALNSIINCAVMIQDYSLVDDIFDKILKQPELTKDDKRSLFSACGRIYLQIGDIFGAEYKFAEARRLKDINSPPDASDLIDKGLIAVAKSDFQEAYSNFQKAHNLDPQNTLLLNNMGVCQLYSGKLKNAIKLFEKSIDQNPQKALNEHLLVNLATLYELESSNSRDKKLNILRLVNRFKADLNVSLDFCLKLQTNN